MNNKTKFSVGCYMQGGYPVRLSGCSWHIAVFVEESEAKYYAEYRTKMLDKFDTIDMSEYGLEKNDGEDV